MSIKKDFTRRLLEALWKDFAERCPHARIYQELLDDAGGVLVHDHLTFRSLGTTVDEYDLGINALLPIFMALKFEEKGLVDYPAQKVHARYAQHEEPDFPKVFVSQLNVDEMDVPTQRLIQEAVKSSRPLITDEDIESLRELDTKGEPEGLLEKVLKVFSAIPWGTPSEEIVKSLSNKYPYAAWVLLHGYHVHHFTGYVNRHGVEGLDNIQGLVEELKKRGVAMRGPIEGAIEGKLRSCATESVEIPVDVSGSDGKMKQLPWAFSHMEFYQRGEVEDNGERRLFQGFPGAKPLIPQDENRAR